MTGNSSSFLNTVTEVNSSVSCRRKDASQKTNVYSTQLKFSSPSSTYTVTISSTVTWSPKTSSLTLLATCESLISACLKWKLLAIMKLSRSAEHRSISLQKFYWNKGMASRSTGGPSAAFSTKCWQAILHFTTKIEMNSFQKSRTTPLNCLRISVLRLKT